MTYAVTKKFHSGLLEGMEYKCLTGVKFEVGKDYGEYIVTFCKPVDEENDVIAVEGSKFGVPCAFSNPLGVCIHKYAGCGDNLYLSCNKLGIDTQNLHTEDFNEAVEKAKQIIETYSRRIFLDAQTFFESTEENVMVKY